MANPPHGYQQQEWGGIGTTAPPSHHPLRGAGAGGADMAELEQR